jgi:EAL domain-containing protein (putative c-di-GMP-specific phosphodiesterase class I)
VSACQALANIGRPVAIELAEHHHVPESTLLRSLDQLRELGLLIAVDDVGTGQSGPEFVQLVRPNIIKIDHTHVSHISRSDAQQNFIQRYIEMAQDTDAMLITEGVSSPRIAAAVREMARRYEYPIYGQGYWLSGL